MKVDFVHDKINLRTVIKVDQLKLESVVLLKTSS